MCGIAGFVGTGDKDTLERMSIALARRGPDDRGIFLGKGFGFAHTRLSIIDLSDGGHQPMESGSGRTSIVFNGEIYNYRDLKEKLRGSYSFKSESDTEVILALYERDGVAAFSKLAGMFAFALFDHEKNELVLVRDRMGKKPLYYTLIDGTLIFGSELKALMQHPIFKKEIDPEALRHYLVYECVPTPRSIFNGVKKVEAGGYLSFTKGVMRGSLYWNIPRRTVDMSILDAMQVLDTKIADAVKSRLVSDVPLGVFLSGGLDSSTVAYYAREAVGSDLETFSVGFTDPDFDESEYARTVARELGVRHTEEKFSPEKCIELIPEVFSYLDEPIADPSALPTCLLSAFAKKHVSVALGGDGADELFAGYPTFQAEALVRTYEMIPKALRNSLIEPLVRSLPVNHTYFSLDFKLKKFIEGVDVSSRYRHQQWLSAFTPEESLAMLSPDMKEAAGGSPYTHLDQFFRGDGAHETFMNDVLLSYLRTYCMDEVMVKVDRMSMAHGLEVRSPFLDHTVVEFVLNLPYDFKFRHMKGKYILKEMMRGRLPDRIIDRRKKGFAVPVGRWLLAKLKPLAHDLLSKEAIEKSGVFDPKWAGQLLAEHESGVADHRKKLWTLMAFQLWYRNWARV